MTIKVQIKGVLSCDAIISHGVPTDKELITFHAFNDIMKARVLDLMVRYPDKVLVTQTNDIPRTGEWYESAPIT